MQNLKPQEENKELENKMKREFQGLDQMVNDIGWKLLEKEIFAKLEKDLKIISGDGISTLVDGDLNKIKYTEFDLLRVRRGVMQEILKIPSQLMQKKKPKLSL